MIYSNKSLKYLFLYISFILILEPNIFVKFTFINYIFILGIILIFLYLFFKEVLIKQKVSSLLLSLIIFRLSFGIQTIINNGDIMRWGYWSLNTITICLMFEYYSKSIDKLLKILYNILLVYLIINYFSFMLYPEGIIDELYFLGIRTRFTDIIFTLLPVSCYLDIKKYGKLGSRTVVATLLSILHIVHFWIATALIGLIVLLILFFLSIYQHDLLIRKLSLPFTMIMSIILTIVLIYAVNNSVYIWFIEGVLGKSLTLSGRIPLWLEAYDVWLNSPLLGYGMSDNGNFILSFYRGDLVYRQSHNQWLQLLHDGGIVCLLAFYNLISKVGSLNKIIYTHKECRPIYLFIITIIVMMISEIYSYHPYFYILLFASYIIAQNYNEEDKRFSLVLHNKTLGGYEVI